MSAPPTLEELNRLWQEASCRDAHSDDDPNTEWRSTAWYAEQWGIQRAATRERLERMVAAGKMERSAVTSGTGGTKHVFRIKPS